MFVVFFKQKTAYEMRISDWSSDVCSSDLHLTAEVRRIGARRIAPRGAAEGVASQQTGKPAMPSFDIVSETDLNEVDNAIAGMQREIATRYDFKGSKCSIERKEAVLTIVADDDLKDRKSTRLNSSH